MRNLCNSLVVKPENKRPLWEGNIREVGCKYVDWIQLARFCDHGNESSSHTKEWNSPIS
jgi:hypothetical protein